MSAGHADVDVVYGPVTMEYWSESGSERSELPIPEPHDEWILLARWFLPQTGAPLWRKSALVDIGGWKADQPCCQEHELYLRLLMAGKRFVYCDAGGAVYRQWSDQTVCRRDVPEVNRQRLSIVGKSQEFLERAGWLSAQRLNAINQSRLEVARTTWQADRGTARNIVKTIFDSAPHFVPLNEAASPFAYRASFAMIGFDGAERIARFVRSTRRLLFGMTR